jgi:hypothetical protein
MNDKTKNWLVGSFVGFVVVSLLIGVGYFFYAKKVKSALGKQVDETKLLIGVPYQNDEQNVDLILNAKSPSGVYSKTLHSQDLQKIDGQDESLRFYDYAADPLIALGGKSVGAWLADTGNTLKAKTVGDSLITSSEVAIASSGVWMINVAASDGGTPTVSHSYVYTNNVAEATGGNS